MAEQRDLRRSPELDSAGWPEDEYSADLGHDRDRVDLSDTTAVTRPLGHHEAARLRRRLGKSADRLTVLEPGTRLQQGSTYLDLNRLDEGPFSGMAGTVVEEGQLIVSKRDIDYELWDELVGQADRA